MNMQECARALASPANRSFHSILVPVIYKRTVFEFIALLLIQKPYATHAVRSFIRFFRSFSVLCVFYGIELRTKKLKKETASE